MKSLILALVFSSVAMAETYYASINTSSGSYNVYVEVDNCSISHVIWPNGGRAYIYGADLDCDGYSCEANGQSSRGDSWYIEIDDNDLAKECR